MGGCVGMCLDVKRQEWTEGKVHNWDKLENVRIRDFLEEWVGGWVDR